MYRDAREKLDLTLIVAEVIVAHHLVKDQVESQVHNRPEQVRGEKLEANLTKVKRGLRNLLVQVIKLLIVRERAPNSVMVTIVVVVTNGHHVVLVIAKRFVAIKPVKVTVMFKVPSRVPAVTRQVQYLHFRVFSHRQSSLCWKPG